MSAPTTEPRRPAGADRSDSRSRAAFRIARVDGIDIRVHVSFLLLVAAIVWLSSTSTGPGAAAAVIWVVMVFGCVALHELGHSLVARTRGARVVEILLMPLGGVSRMENLPERPADELAIAAAGPAVSLTIAAAAAIAGAVTHADLWPPDLIGGSLLGRLMWINVMLGVFNLLPAFPLDGGRVLRALLHERMPLVDATRKAARIGRGFAIALALVGLAVDIWLVLIAVFVWFGASAEEAATIIHARIGGLAVSDVMIESPVVADGHWRAVDFEPTARHSAQRVFPVVADGRYLGVLDRIDLTDPPTGATLGQLADPDAPTLATDDALEEIALPALARSRGHASTVVTAGQVVGILRQEDVASLLDAARRPNGRRTTA